MFFCVCLRGGVFGGWGMVWISAGRFRDLRGSRPPRGRGGGGGGRSGGRLRGQAPESALEPAGARGPGLKAKRSIRGSGLPPKQWSILFRSGNESNWARLQLGALSHPFFWLGGLSPTKIDCRKKLIPLLILASQIWRT